MIECSLCERQVSYTTKHHLIPQGRQNKQAKAKHTSEELHKTIRFCVDCHRMVHALLTEKELERNYNSLELLKANEEVAKYISWVRTKAEGVVTHAKRKE